MRAIVIGIVGAGLVLSAPADAAPGRVEKAYYIAPGGAALGTGTLYGSTPRGNVGLARAVSRAGEKQARVSVTDSSARPVAVRVEALRGGRINVLVACAAGNVGPIDLKGATELRVLPLAGACEQAGGVTVSAPTSGEVSFTFTR